MASVREIAKKAGVSGATVSRVLNNQTKVSNAARQKVLTAINQSGYVPTVGRRSTANIAYVYTDEFSLGSPYDAAAMCGIASGLESCGLDLIILHTRHSRQPDETYSQMFMRKGVRGAIIRATTASRHICTAIAEEGFPAVVMGERFDDPRVRYVGYESRQASREAVNYLIEQGHRRIAMCTNVVDDTDHIDRVAGYIDALQDHGLESEQKMLLRVPAHRPGGQQMIRRVMAMKDRPTALYIADPFTCIGASTEAHVQGVSIPRDLSIVGFDDGDIRYSVYPQMSAVCQDAGALGREAFDLLVEVMNDGPAGNDTSVTCSRTLRAWFEVHNSSGAPAELTASQE